MAYRTNFKSLAEIGTALGEAEAVRLMNAYLTNLNYRSDYNAKKNALYKAVKNDPRVREVVDQLRKKA